MSGYFALDPRPLAPEDRQGARVLLLGALGVTPYIDRALEVLEEAERSRGDDAEHRAIVIARDGTVAGIAIFGIVTGTMGAAKLHIAALAAGVDAEDVGVRLMESVASAARDSGARFLLAEVPDDPAVGAILTLLEEHDFVEEARVPDFYRDGVALRFLKRRL